MDQLDFAFGAIFILCIAGVTYFVWRSIQNNDWLVIEGIAAQFLAVFAAISIGILIADGERARERLEKADGLARGALQYSSSVIEKLSTDRFVLLQPVSWPNNVVEALLSSSEFYGKRPVRTAG